MALTFQKFYTVINPNEDTAKIPWYFCEHFRDELENEHEVLFVDTRGTTVVVCILMYDYVAHFYRGLNRLLEHYQQPNGLNLVLNYNGNCTFYMGVLDLDMMEVVNKELVHYKRIEYSVAPDLAPELLCDTLEAPPEVPTVTQPSVEVGCDDLPFASIAKELPTADELKGPPDSPEIIASTKANETLNVNKLPNDDHNPQLSDVEMTESDGEGIGGDAMITCIIPLTERKVTINNLYLPSRFVRDAFVKDRPSSVSLIDAVGDVYNCSLFWKHNESNHEAYLRGKWTAYTKRSGLFSGCKVRLADDLDKPEIIYARMATPEEV